MATIVLPYLRTYNKKSEFNEILLYREKDIKQYILNLLKTKINEL